MFSNPKNSSSNVKIDTLIGASTNLTGNINSSGAIIIYGRFIGDIVTEGDVTIGSGAQINGDITAANVIISGNVEGNISCTGTLEIVPTGRLVGDVNVANLDIEKGAIFNGKCNVVSNNFLKLNEPAV